VLLIPVMAVVVPTVSGLIVHSRHSAAGLAASYLYFTVVSFVIWQGNRLIYFRLQQREDWLLRPRRRIARLLGAIALYTVPVFTAMVWGWQAATGDPGAGPYSIPMALLVTVTGVVIITHAYETVFLLRDWESDRLRRARTEQARLEAELEALEREVDPHFLFNHLNALVQLIEQRSDAASAFVVALGDTYRYVLESRGRRLVPLATELEALRRHEVLGRLRFGSSVSLDVRVPEDAFQRYQLPPVSLGELFQNALKHNDTAAPIAIEVRLESDVLVVANPSRPVRRAGGRSTGLGLANLSRRFRMATGRDVTWEHAGGRFVVRLPLVDARAGGPGAV
jgi:hypothetical protein